MRLSSFVAARSAKIEAEEILRLKELASNCRSCVECLLIGQNDAMDGFQDAVGYLSEQGLNAIADIIQGTIMRSIIHFDFELATLRSIDFGISKSRETFDDLSLCHCHSVVLYGSGFTAPVFLVVVDKNK